ncbi:MAG: hypothetical protein II160_04540 [Selenomonas sp.]|nr:hypothetical protein [Selenomonas sp.]
MRGAPEITAQAAEGSVERHLYAVLQEGGEVDAAGGVVGGDGFGEGQACDALGFVPETCCGEVPLVRFLGEQGVVIVVELVAGRSIVAGGAGDQRIFGCFIQLVVWTHVPSLLSWPIVAGGQLSIE